MTGDYYKGLAKSYRKRRMGDGGGAMKGHEYKAPKNRPRYRTPGVDIKITRR